MPIEEYIVDEEITEEKPKRTRADDEKAMKLWLKSPAGKAYIAKAKRRKPISKKKIHKIWGKKGGGKIFYGYKKGGQV